jgi:hypothetical protein
MDPDIVLVLEEATGLCVNAVVSGPGWSPGPGYVTVLPADGAWIGWTLTDNGWVPPLSDGG